MDNINYNSIKKSISLLKNNHIIGIFPEGTRSLDGSLLELNSGVMKMALLADVPIIPVGLNGTYEIFPPTSRFPSIFKRHTIYINFGKPSYFDKNKHKDTQYIDESLAIIKNEIELLSRIPRYEY